jgi:hypothetical protein
LPPAAKLPKTEKHASGGKLFFFTPQSGKKV